jgi:orotidine-5'-phosphate decarboxylase
MSDIASFTDRLIVGIKEKKSILIVGLDPQFRFMPPHLVEKVSSEYGKTLEGIGHLFFEFNKEIIDAVLPFTTAVKPQMAFYEMYGMWGLWAFEQTVAYAKSKGLLIITDAKRGDGSDTANAYASGYLGTIPVFEETVASPIQSDALTIHGYIAEDCVPRFVKIAKENGTGIFVVDKTSFKPNSSIEQLKTQSGLTVWQELATLIQSWGEGSEGKAGYRNVGVVMGATYPEDATWMRKTLPNSWFLVPGYGGQGGSADEAVISVNSDGFGASVSSSRAIIYAYREGPYKNKPEQFALAAASAAEFSKKELNAALERAGKLTF